jgi:hypothetical protein
MEARSVIEVVEYDEAWPVRAAAATQDALAGLGYRRFDTGMPGRLSPPGARLGGVSYRADQPPSSRYEEPLANDAGAEQR